MVALGHLSPFPQAFTGRKCWQLCWQATLATYRYSSLACLMAQQTNPTFPPLSNLRTSSPSLTQAFRSTLHFSLPLPNPLNFCHPFCPFNTRITRTRRSQSQSGLCLGNYCNKQTPVSSTRSLPLTLPQLRTNNHHRFPASPAKAAPPLHHGDVRFYSRR